MPCFSPLQAWRTSKGEIVFWRRQDAINEFKLPCGGCEGCLLERSRQWAVRCMHEAQLWEKNCFITLTYEDPPPWNSLVHSDFQKFMKRLRKRFKGDRELVDDRTGKSSHPIRFYMAGEYGSARGRPHYHACIFNFAFEDLKFLRRTNSGSDLYRSAQLESLWPHGYSSVGDVTFESAAYVARYVMKKQNQEIDVHAPVDLETGEVIQRLPEYNRMSLKPGIGANFVDKYKSDVFPNDYVVVNGHKAKPPRYYFKRLEQQDPDLYEQVEYSRAMKGLESCEENTVERLGARQKVLQAKLKQLQRNL
ncbi:replication initiator protein [Microviridae sp.]|nr:replication initiator protein [Microviridae sp.]